MRTTGEGDKRVIYAVLTDKGRGVFESVFTQNAERLKHSWTPLTDREKQQLVNMLARLRIHLLAKNEGDALKDMSSFSSGTAAEPIERRPDELPRRRQRNS